jgi:hypothetical protein
MPVVAEDLVAGRADSAVGGLGLARLAAVDLAPGVVVDVEAAPARRAQRVGPRRHRLRPQRVLRPRGGHLVADHAARVVVQAHLVHHQEAPGLLRHELAPVGALAIHVDPVPAPGGAGVPARGDPSTARASQDDLRSSVGELIGAPPAKVLAARRASAAEPDRADAGRKQDPYLPARLGDARVAVIVLQDRAVAAAVLRVAVGAVLAHAHAVSEATALDHPARRGGARRERAGRERRAHRGDDRNSICSPESHLPALARPQ